MRLLGAAALVAGAQGLPDAVEETGLRGRPGESLSRNDHLRAPPAGCAEHWAGPPGSTMAMIRVLALVTGQHTGSSGHSASRRSDTPEVSHRSKATGAGYRPG